MYKYEVGTIINGFQHHEECVKFDFTDDGCHLIYFFNRPTVGEIESVKSGTYEFKLTVLNGVIFFLSKFGGLNWTDAPYSIHLSNQLSEFEELEVTEGYACLVWLVDAMTGELKVIRLIGMENKFSNRLIEEMKNQFQNTNLNLYNEKLADVYKKYSTGDLVKLSVARMKSR